ncbi:glucan biosynthesis protein [Pseudomonas sp. PCH446]
MLYPINKADKQDEIMTMLGASYFRVVGKGQTYGLSARGMAIDTALPSGEEFRASPSSGSSNPSRPTSTW